MKKLQKNEHQLYLLNKKKKRIYVHLARILFIAIVLGIWEICYQFEITDPFLTKSPSRIVKSIYSLFAYDNFIKDVNITLYETIVGFVISTCLGTLIALCLWWFDFLRKVLEPIIVVLNSLPKIALAPIIIAWFGTGVKSIIFMSVIIGIIVVIISMLNGFMTTEKNKILLLESMGATKFQILYKLVLPSSSKCFISMLKINIGLSWIGTIMGEMTSSKYGIGYVINYGNQVLNLDIVFASTAVLCFLAGGMYVIICSVEKLLFKGRH